MDKKSNLTVIGIVLKAALALLLAFVIINCALMFYERSVGYIDTPDGASIAVRNPGSILVHGTEGYGITRIDANGYTNSGTVLGDDYILMLGSSHTQGKEVSPDKKYSELVNTYLTGGKEERATYNIACDANYFPQIIQHFPATVATYPQAKCITIEMPSTDYTVEEIREALDQVREADTSTASELFETMGLMGKLKNTVKEYAPLLSIVKNNIETYQRMQGENDRTPIDKEEYYKTVREALALIRSEYDGKMVVVYHPETVIQKDGSLDIARSETADIFAAACAEAGIDFIDTGDRFIETYRDEHKLPYGFQNTSFDEGGHLNTTGHRIIAEAIIDYVEGACR